LDRQMAGFTNEDMLLKQIKGHAALGLFPKIGINKNR